MIRSETTTKDLCTACGEELHDFKEWTAHRRKHHLEYWSRERPEIIEMLKSIGFKDEPEHNGEKS